MDGNDFRFKMVKEANEVKKKVRERILTYLGAGLGLVVGLAWNDAIASLIKFLFPVGANAIWVKFLYALVLTLLVTLAIIALEKTLKNDEEEMPDGPKR